MASPGQPRGAARLVAGFTVVLIGACLGGLIGGCAANQGPASPTESAEPGSVGDQQAPSGTAAPTESSPTETSAAPLPLPAPQPNTPLVRPGPGLDTQDRDQLAQAQRVGAQWVVLVVATDTGHTEEAAAELRSIGGVIGTSNPAPGYLRVTMPVANVERAVTLPAVTAVDVTEVIPPNQPGTNGTTGNR
jgi:hypothetical protein